MLYAGCGSDSSNKVSYYLKGFAAFYELEENGKPTSDNYARYDRNELTAAQPNLPYGTKVMVTNLNNGRKATLTINDHDMPEGEYIIKLSEKAARDLVADSSHEFTIHIITWG